MKRWKARNEERERKGLGVKGELERLNEVR